MKFSIGDRVMLRQTGEEGIVTGFIGQDMLEVEVHGTHFPIYADEVDHPYLKWFTEKKAQKKKSTAPEQLPVEKEKQRPQRLPRGIYLSFLPVFISDHFEDVVEQLKIYLINETPVPVRFSYDARLLHQSAFSHEGVLHAFGHLYLHSIAYEMMNDQPRFHWQLADASDKKYRAEEGILRIKAQKLFQHIHEGMLNGTPTFSYKLVEDFVAPRKTDKEEPITSVPIREIPPKPPKISSFGELPRYELDLHIEQLVKDHKGWSNAAILDVQLRTLERYLHLAIIHRMERMIVIHGLGSGVLKNAVHELLRQTPEVKRFGNEWMGKYGFGATEVIFRR